MPKACPCRVERPPWALGFDWRVPCLEAALLPKLPVYEPDLRFLLKDGQDSDSKLLAEGRIGLAEHLPWVSDKAKAK